MSVIDKRNTASLRSEHDDGVFALLSVTPRTVRYAGISVLAGALWTIFSLPIILLGQWFPLDLGGIFAQKELQWILSPYNGSGRYVPFYWLFHRFEFFLFGPNVTPYYIVQSIIVLAASLLTSAVLFMLTGRHRYAAAVLIGVYLSTGLPENVSTLGKPEPIAYFFVIFIIALFSATHLREHSPVRKRNAVVSAVLVSAAFPLAIWTKETSTILLGFCATGLLIGILLRKMRHSAGYTGVIKDYWQFGIALFVGLCVAKVPYILFAPTTRDADYTDYQITFELVEDNFIFYVSNQPDIIILGSLAMLLLVVAGKRVLIHDAAPCEFEARSYIFVFSLCAMAWVYCFGLLIWRWPMGYYMLLPGSVFRMCLLYGIYITNAHILVKWPIRCAMYVIIAVATLYVGLYAYYIISSQIAYSRIYTGALEAYAYLARQKEPLVLESYPFFAEQAGGTEQVLLTETGHHHTVRGIADVLDPEVVANKQLLKLLKVTQADIEANMANVPRRGDYLLVFTGNKLATWFLRGVTPFYCEDSLLKLQGAYDMELVDARTIESPALYVDLWTHRLAGGETWIGYKLYKVLDEGPRFLWRGRYPDGWAGRVSSLTVSPSYGRPIVIKISAPEFALPQKVRITENGRLIDELLIAGTDEKSVTLSDVVKSSAVFQFEAEKAVVPRMIGFNGDRRPVSVRLTLSGATQ